MRKAIISLILLFYILCGTSFAGPSMEELISIAENTYLAGNHQEGIGILAVKNEILPQK